MFIGRCQPPHAAHVASVLAALDVAPRALVLLGSANLARSVRNPLSAGERALLLRGAVREAGGDVRRLEILPLSDRFDATRWATDVHVLAADVFGPSAPVTLVGHEKDDSAAYLRWFPSWRRLVLAGVPGLNATDIREAWFTGRVLPPGVPPRVAHWLGAFGRSAAFSRLQAEWTAVQDVRSHVPAGVRLHEERRLHVRDRCVWLATRSGAIGQGLWELPGRMLPVGETPTTPGVVFDHPARSLVGQAVAHVSTGPPSEPSRPVPLATALARPRRFHEDHHVILTRLLDAGRTLP